MASSSQDSQEQPFHWHYSGFEDKSFHFHGRALLLIIILFSLLILFTLLCLYARWVCRYSDHQPAASTTNAAAPPDGTAAGLDHATINSFPTLLHCSSSDETAAQCSICLSSFRDEEKVKVLPDCNHTYHPHCVDEWLSSRSSCPLCRASLRLHPPIP
ncbi:hypothetical protein Scep_005711 [Stephania cephalantha]|uniref:RING-type E3 ubiquitin transferase n=1 Tax=Stephania cephalantha TaxID=152367 RepID=A0AAP0KWI9_9MAGN